MLNQLNESNKKIQCPKCDYKYLTKIKKSFKNSDSDFEYYCPFCMSEFNKSINYNCDNYNQKQEIPDDKNKEDDFEKKTEKFKPFGFK